MQNPYDKWFRMRNEMREADIKRKSLIQTIADFIQKILPSNTTLSSGTPKSELPDFSPRLSKPVSPSVRSYTDNVTASPSSLTFVHETMSRRKHH